MEKLFPYMTAKKTGDFKGWIELQLVKQRENILESGMAKNKSLEAKQK